VKEQEINLYTSSEIPAYTRRSCKDLESCQDAKAKPKSFVTIIRERIARVYSPTRLRVSIITLVLPLFL
jgi:hypothetical protein